MAMAGHSGQLKAKVDRPGQPAGKGTLILTKPPLPDSRGLCRPTSGTTSQGQSVPWGTNHSIALANPPRPS